MIFLQGILRRKQKNEHLMIYAKSSDRLKVKNGNQAKAARWKYSKYLSAQKCTPKSNHKSNANGYIPAGTAMYHDRLSFSWKAHFRTYSHENCQSDQSALWPGLGTQCQSCRSCNARASSGSKCQRQWQGMADCCQCTSAPAWFNANTNLEFQVFSIFIAK